MEPDTDISCSAKIEMRIGGEGRCIVSLAGVLSPFSPHLSSAPGFSMCTDARESPLTACIIILGFDAARDASRSLRSN